MLSPPAVVPCERLKLETVGAGGINEKRSAVPVAEFPDGVVIVTSTVPADSWGSTAVIWVAELMTKEAAATDPNFTDVAPVRLVPVTMTLVPPAVEPEVTLSPLTVGAFVAVTVALVDAMCD